MQETLSLRKTVPKNFIRDKIIIIEGGDDKQNRKAVSSKNVDILLNPQLGNRKDTPHQRNSGLNQVLCKLAKQNNVAIGFSIKPIQKAKKRRIVLGRIMQNIQLCRKYKIPIIVGIYEEEKNQKDTLALFKVLGMRGKELQVSKDFIEKRLDWKRRYVRKGVMREK